MVLRVGLHPSYYRISSIRVVPYDTLNISDFTSKKKFRFKLTFRSVYYVSTFLKKKNPKTKGEKFSHEWYRQKAERSDRTSWSFSFRWDKINAWNEDVIMRLEKSYLILEGCVMRQAYDEGREEK